MPRNELSPGAVVAAHGARKDVQAGSWNTSENIPTLSGFQADWLARRLHLSKEVAQIVAEVAFPQKEARL